jgi:hypothetical protein
MSQIKVTGIQAADIEEVGRFLHEHLNGRIPAADWTRSLRHEWSASRPNYGAQIRDDGKLAGVMLALYSEQEIGGRMEAFCNPHSWCVLPEYRNQGIGLVLHLIKQPGYHFTMLTPNPKVAQIFRGLRFKDLDDGLYLFPNLPSASAPLRGIRVEAAPERIAAMLPGPLRRDFELHRRIPWLRFLAAGKGDDVCLLVYKTTTVKRLPCARVIHVSDPAAFGRYRAALQNHLLLREGLMLSRVESRFLGVAPPLTYRSRRTQAKLFSSKSIEGSQIRDLYSELVALDV